MNCNEFRELMPDLAAGLPPASAEAGEHLRACAACAGKLEEMRKTMALLDEWRAPEPSPYFDVRLHARLREEAAKPTGWWQWMRRPALALAAAVLVVVSVSLLTRNHGVEPGAGDLSSVVQPVPGQRGTAVGDLQALDNNHDLYSDFDVLDELQVPQDKTASP